MCCKTTHFCTNKIIFQNSFCLSAKLTFYLFLCYLQLAAAVACYLVPWQISNAQMKDHNFYSCCNLQSSFLPRSQNVLIFDPAAFSLLLFSFMKNNKSSKKQIPVLSMNSFKDKYARKETNAIPRQQHSWMQRRIFRMFVLLDKSDLGYLNLLPRKKRIVLFRQSFWIICKSIDFVLFVARVFRN